MHFFKNVDLSNIVTSNKLNKVITMFENCYNLREINFGSNFHSENITDISYMFHNCYKLEKITWKNKQSFTNLFYMTKTFCSCKKLKQVDLRGINFNRIKVASNMFTSTNSNLEVVVNNTFKNCLC